MKRSLKFPKQLFVAKEVTTKHTYFEAAAEPSKLVGFIDEKGNLEVATYELVEVKKFTLMKEE